MIDGPGSAPSSPPDTPTPTKCRPFSASAASRRRVSSKCALPASMTMSPGLQQRHQLLDDGVGRRARLDHDQHPAWTLQVLHQLGGLRANEVALVAVRGKQRVGLGHRAVVQGDGVAVAGEVAGEVRAHDGQAGDADLCRHAGLSSGFRWGWEIPSSLARGTGPLVSAPPPREGTRPPRAYPDEGPHRGRVR